MQISKIELDRVTAYCFAKLQLALGNRSAQRTFDELLTACWYLVTQQAKPGMVDMSQEPKAQPTIFNFDLVNIQYEQKFLELKRRLALSGTKATNNDTVIFIVRTVYDHCDRYSVESSY